MSPSSMFPAALIALAATLPAAPQTAVPETGRNLAAACANCHGTNGNSAGGIESLAGAQQSSTAKRMKDFKAGTRIGTVMPQIAKGYSDEQIELIAAYLASQAPAPLAIRARQ